MPNFKLISYSTDIHLSEQNENELHKYHSKYSDTIQLLDDVIRNTPIYLMNETDFVQHAPKDDFIEKKDTWEGVPPAEYLGLYIYQSDLLNNKPLILINYNRIDTLCKNHNVLSITELLLIVIIHEYAHGMYDKRADKYKPKPNTDKVHSIPKNTIAHYIEEAMANAFVLYYLDTIDHTGLRGKAESFMLKQPPGYKEGPEMYGYIKCSDVIYRMYPRFKEKIKNNYAKEDYRKEMYEEFLNGYEYLDECITVNMENYIKEKYGKDIDLVNTLKGTGIFNGF